jgi:hypothetical protein
MPSVFCLGRGLLASPSCLLEILGGPPGICWGRALVSGMVGDPPRNRGDAGLSLPRGSGSVVSDSLLQLTNLNLNEV